MEQQVVKLKANLFELYKQRYAEMRLSLDEKDGMIKGIKEQLHKIYKGLYDAGII